ncbi:hypothetical protein ACOMHN_058563 [Nucella lapillus]
MMKKNAVVNFSSAVVFIAEILVFFFFFASEFSVTRCEATLVHGKVSKVQLVTPNKNAASTTANDSNHSATISDPSYPHHPSSSPPLPSSLRVDVKLGGQDVHLKLARDRGFEPLQLPVYVLSTDRGGRLQSSRARLNDTEFSVYQDIENEGAFGVFREKDANGTSHYKLQGIVRSQGFVYKIKTKDSADSKNRHRRDVAANSTDDKTFDNDENDKQASTDDDDDDKDDEEFEVTVLSAEGAYEADSLPKPAMPEHPGRKKVMAVLKEEETILKLHHPLPSPSPHTPPPAPQRRRRRRQGSRPVYVDVVMAVDYGVYKAWYDRSSGSTTAQKQQNTLTNIRRYYAIVMNGVNLLYRSISTLSYRINVRLVGIIVSSMGSSSPWTEQFKTTARGARWNRVDASAALSAFKSWAATTDVLPAYDHLMLFTGYDLSRTTSTGIVNTGITGLAYTGTVCGTEGQAVSIVEDLGGFQCVSTAAHELGHGLSAEHDGDKNGCRSEDRYVMAAGTYPTTPSNKLHPWSFSSCSVSYFNNFVRRTVVTARGQQCLYNALSVEGNVPDVTSLMPGQLYDPDAQCRQVYGAQSRLCRGSEFGQVGDICTDMYCYDPSTTSTCVKLVAARGTSCGNQKWCQNGRCMTDAAAPVADDTCMFGDQPGVAFDGNDCQTFVTGFPGYCYQKVVRTRCCASCGKHLRLLTGCKYGDKARGCSSSVCKSADATYLASCCGICNYGTTFTTTPLSTLPTPATCADVPTFTISQMTCPDLVAKEPQLCYDVMVVSKCCRSCRGAASGTSGCMYGDRDPLRCTEARNNSTACSTLQSACCKTCAGYTSSSPSSFRFRGGIGAIPVSVVAAILASFVVLL